MHLMNLQLFLIIPRELLTVTGNLTSMLYYENFQSKLWLYNMQQANYYSILLVVPFASVWSITLCWRLKERVNSWLQVSMLWFLTSAATARDGTFESTHETDYVCPVLHFYFFYCCRMRLAFSSLCLNGACKFYLMRFKCTWAALRKTYGSCTNVGWKWSNHVAAACSIVFLYPISHGQFSYQDLSELIRSIEWKVHMQKISWPM